MAAPAGDGGGALGAAVATLPGIGEASAGKLARLGIDTAADLILHLPMRYQDRTRSVPLDELVPGAECLVTGQVVRATVAHGGRRSLVVVIGDGRGTLAVRFFHFNARQQAAMQPNLWMRCFGAVRAVPGNLGGALGAGLEMVHPEYRLHAEEPDAVAESLTPVYRVTQGVTSPRLGRWVAAALERCRESPCSRIEDAEFPELMAAIDFLHAPPADCQAGSPRIRAARERLALDELAGHYLAMKQRRALLQSAPTRALPPRRQLGRQLLRDLGFRLTRAQARVAGEVLRDISGERPMMRLLQGDVGCGKTVVAAFAAIRAAENDCQTAFMAPTEILAEQHYETLSGWLAPLGIDIAVVTGRQRAAERRARLAAIRDGQAMVAVGTHALFQSGVEFHDLALTIIDEQHRFGVHQRLSLRDKGRLPHQLVMTATPIPRTLTMALYADMDVSTIDELPPGRQPVRTRTAPARRRDEVIDYLARLCASGRQAYWICTLIDEDEDGDSRQKAAETAFLELSAQLPDKLRVALVHGRLPAARKSAVMAAFKAGEIDVLVATTVVEVGVDVPNASAMVIENAERLGLAQLHQLRGRVGRGGGDSVCILVFEPPLSSVAQERLRTMRETSDGFRIAEKDLELRGPGDILGTRQTGEQAFRIVDLAVDRALVPRAVALGEKLLAEDPEAATRVVDTWARRQEVAYAAV